MKYDDTHTKQLQAGAAQTDITPPKGTRIGVDFLSHFARFIHDPLFSKALVFKKGSTLYAFVMVDICIMPSDFMDLVKARIEAASKIKKEHITLACTHTHGAGDIAGLLGGAVDIAYRNRLPDLIVKSVTEALGRLKPAKVASGRTMMTGYHVCRRYSMEDGYEAKNPVTGELDTVKTNPFGAESSIVESVAPVDPEVCFLAVKSLDDDWISVFGNYASHYAADWDVDTITADFYGSFAQHLSNKLDTTEDFVAIMSYGTGADVNTWDFQHPNKFPEQEFYKTEKMGGDLANVVRQEFEHLNWIEDAEIQIAYEELELQIRKPNAKELSRAEEHLEAHKFENLELNEHGISMIYAREQLLLNEYPETHTAAIQILKIGNQIIGASGGELFTETGLWLKGKAKGYNYFTVCLANTYDGYVPPAHELEKGGYETWRARSSFLDGIAEEKIKTSMVKLIEKL